MWFIALLTIAFTSFFGLCEAVFVFILAIISVVKESKDGNVQS